MNRCPCPCRRRLPVRPTYRTPAKYFSRACQHRAVSAEQRAQWSREGWARRAQQPRPWASRVCACPCGRRFLVTRRTRRYFGRGCWMRDPKYRTVVLKRNRAMQMAAARQHFALVVERAGRFPTKAAAYGGGQLQKTPPIGCATVA